MMVRREYVDGKRVSVGLSSRHLFKYSLLTGLAMVFPLTVLVADVQMREAGPYCLIPSYIGADDIRTCRPPHNATRG